MFDRLIELWKIYLEAKVADPYCRDQVQSWGMAFAYEWNIQKENLMQHFNIKEDDWAYPLSMKLMPQLC